MLVRVADETHQRPWFDLNTESMRDFTSEGVAVRLPPLKLNAPSGELPKQRQYRRGSPLRNQVSAVAFDHRCDDANR
jgi:hypothetical protein